MGDGTRAYLRWTDTSATEAHFEIVREKASGVTWGEQAVLTAPKDAVNKMDFPGAGLFRYRMRAVNAAGGSLFTSWTFCQVELVPPTAPWNLTFSDMGDGERARLDWTDRSNNESRFEIIRQRQSSSGVWYGDTVLIAAANTETYVNRPGVGSYRYRIRSVNAAGSSVWSGWVNGVIAPLGSSGGNTTAPAAPTNLEAVNLGDGVRAYLRWDDNADNEDGYRVFRDQLVAGAWTQDGSIEVEPNATNLTDSPGVGTFRYAVRAFNEIGPSPFSNAATTTVELLAPTVPTDLEFTDLGDGLRGQVRWTDRSNNEDGFEILRQRQDAAGAWSGDTVLMGAANTEVLNNMPGPGTFRYRIRSANDAGTSAWSGWLVGIIADVAPAAPNGLSGADLGNQSQVQLTWTDNSHNESGFELERETQSGTTWGAPAALSAGPNLESVTDSPGVGTHRYRVRSVNAVGPSAWSTWTEVSVGALPPPAAPSSLLGMSLMNGSQVRLTWTDNATNETGFEIERQSEQTFTWGPAVTITVGVNSQIHTDTPGLGMHRYRVRAIGAGGASAYTAWVQVQVVSPFPAAPNNLAVVSMNDGLRARATWADNSNNETGFQIERQTLAGTAWGSNATNTVAANETVFVDAPGLGTHRYRVRSVNAAGGSAYTPWASVNIVALAPAAPSGLIAASLNDGMRARLDWTDNSSNETGFQIERQTLSGTTWGSPGMIAAPANAVTYTDTPGVGTYRYRVRAVNMEGQSAYTAWAQVTVAGTVPAAPSGLQVVDTGNRRALLSWSDNSSNETRFDIERLPAFSAGVVSVSANVTGYIDNCGAGTFQYRVRSANAAGVSPWTGWVSVVIQDIIPAAPSGLAVVDMGNQSQVRLTWIDNSDNETGFTIEKQTQQSGGTWGATGVLSAAANTTTRTDAPGLGTHRYRVAAVGAVGVSPFTLWSTVTVSTGATPPTAVITLMDQTSTRMAPAAVHVHATASQLGNPAFRWDRAKFEWDFGDTAGQELMTTDPTNSNTPVNLSKEQQGFNAAYIYRSPGTYTIRLRVTNESGGVHETTRQLTIAADTRATYYVDAVAGSDSNTGLTPTTAWRSFNYAITRMTNNSKVLLKRGQVFTVATVPNLGALSNVTVDSYGAGARPILRWTGANNGMILQTAAASESVLVHDIMFDSVHSVDISEVEALSPRGRIQSFWDCTFGSFENWIDATGSPTGVLVLAATGSTSRAQQFPIIGSDIVLLGVLAHESVGEHIIRVMPYGGPYGDPSDRINISFCNLNQHNVNGKSALRFQAVQFGTAYRTNLLGGRSDMGHDDSDSDNLVVDRCALSSNWQVIGIHHNVCGLSIRNNTFDLAGNMGGAIRLWKTATFSGLYGADNIDIIENTFVLTPQGNYNMIISLENPDFDVSNVCIKGNTFQVPSSYNEHFLELERLSDVSVIEGNAYTDRGVNYIYHRVGGVQYNWSSWMGLSVTVNETLMPP